MADDAGRLVDNLRQIDAFIFPETEESSREALANLSRMGRIKRGETSSGQRILQIVNWTHQKVDHPNMRAALPVIAKEVSPSLATDSRGVREGFATLSVPVPPTSTITKRKRRPASDEADGGWPVEAFAIWGAKVASLPGVGRIAGPLKASVDAHGWPSTKAGMEAYIFATPNGRHNLQQFVNTANHWISIGKDAPRLPSGDFSMTTDTGDDSELAKIVYSNNRRTA